MLAPVFPSATEPEFRLLYLGNDLKLIAALRQVLAEPVYRLVTCSDRESAVLFFKSDIPYEGLLIDLEWRGKNGLEVARLGRKLPDRKGKPIVWLGGAKLNGRR